jgi:glycerol kinase
MNTGQDIKRTKNGLLTTVFAQFGENSSINYALEGAVEAAGSTIQ